MWNIPAKVVDALNRKILDTLLELGYRDVRRSGKIPVGSMDSTVDVTFRQAFGDVWTSPRNYGNIHITWRGLYHDCRRRIKIKFDWDEPRSYNSTATNYIWSDETTQKLKEKVAEMYKVAETRVQQRQKLTRAEAEFAQAVKAVFPNDDVKMSGFSAKIDGLEIHKTGDSFQFVLTYTGSGELSHIKAVRDDMLEAGQKRYLTL